MNALTPCPCGSRETYQSCCLPFHQGKLWPRTAEQLMRSRYSAFALLNADYLLKTWQKSTRPGEIEFEKELVWTGLEIVATQKGGIRDSRGKVHFKAYYQIGNSEVGILEELSDFKKDAAQHWVYVKGDIL